MTERVKDMLFTILFVVGGIGVLVLLAMGTCLMVDTGFGSHAP
ncbi:MAG TPA: hypothetical protein VM537_21430 [Anaerolineae bacterium]|nr:hypothetical protein [Anaerolineae bacterium]